MGLPGQRVELGEVDHTILRDSAVGEAVTMLCTLESQEPELVSFVTLSTDQIQTQFPLHSAPGDEHVQAWTDHFNVGYAKIDAIDKARLGRDFMGWKSRYDGRPIDSGEMREWLDDTMAAIGAAGQPVNVCEVGTGTGMILFSLPDGLQSYVGLDPSASAVEFVTRMADADPRLATKVRMHTGTAADIEHVGPLNSPDLIVVNSVVQFFPTAEYLYSTVQSLLKVDGVERLFFGDVRSYALYFDFGATKALHTLGEATTKQAVRAQLASMEETEEELLVDPAFFTRLPDLLPDVVAHVEILPKRMKATNELSCFRFAAVIHARQGGTSAPQVHEVAEDEWIDFDKRRLDRQALSRLLQTSADPYSVVAVSNIANAKNVFARHVVDSLNGDAEDTLAGGTGEWLPSTRESARCQPALTAHDLEELAKETGFRVEISWARQHSLRGSFDAVFHRMEGRRPLFRFPTDHESCLTESLTNKPLRRQLKQKVEAHLRAALQATLPAYMVPARIYVLDRMPLNADGKVDRGALTSMAERNAKARAPIATGRNDVERTLCEELGHVFGLEIGISDNFFELGGHLIMATRVVSRINRRLHAAITVRDVFAAPTVAKLAEKVALSVEQILSEESR